MDHVLRVESDRDPYVTSLTERERKSNLETNKRYQRKRGDGLSGSYSKRQGKVDANRFQSYSSPRRKRE